MVLTSITEFDYWILEFFHRLAVAAGGFFTPFFLVITSLGDHGIFLIVLTVLLLCFKKTRKLGAMIAISMFIGFLTSNVIIKNIVKRPRPYSLSGSDYVSWWELTGKLTDSEYSFPSGHATSTAAFCICFIWHYGFKKSWGIIFVPILMAITRLYFVVHYPTDVIAGLLIGTLASLAAFYLTKLLDKTKFMPKFYALPGLENLVRKKEVQPAEANEENKEDIKEDNQKEQK